MRMQLAKGMKINEAKSYVASRLNVRVEQIGDCSVMREIRQELDLGYPMPEPGAAKGIEAKINIARVLGIKINSVERFKAKTKLQ